VRLPSLVSWSPFRHAALTGVLPLILRLALVDALIEVAVNVAAADRLLHIVIICVIY
jgi:hypothetical protein